MKQDNLSGPVYGGNKIRKLEFLLGEAIDNGRKTVITYGAAGSNHALATAVCCRQLGLRAISILAPQETSNHVRKNILMQHSAGAELHLCPNFTDFPKATQTIVERCTQEDSITPYIIPAGGTNATGALGFVNAAFELAKQIVPPASSRPPASRQDGGDTVGLPCPDVIYIPMGTGGTLAGLLVGLKLAGLQTRVEAIRVVDPTFRTTAHIKKLCNEICAKLEKEIPRRGAEDAEQNKISESLRSLRLCEDKSIIIRDEFFGEDYGIPTSEGEKAVEFFQSKESVHLETTYTGKCAAALLHDLRSGALDGQTVLYWNTLNSRDFSGQIADIDFHDLASEFHPYFRAE